ncbi:MULTISPECIES: Asp-tRNA(Asn)/Glu-tRNA(Gln) amidotransferase subunit GatC [Exiguobacterium]|uniref:Asp-tRNA(Asn)/Glu-tRNA(Gln) amidotransferase subunit GatC n=1 Tax=Exiguobacterium TaxID=33986 RepID=UPI00047E5A0C|nr:MULTISPECIES: Asp-tRNA(Asn)/Glu-tRNA(Gln) amidotransferase subunit GatC [Exiguobacterium]MCK2156281.1 Asp-tRNA(Asn)/Glu-tRNA(Gln) amidotransferase subunit GatC [Exiguobacterium sp. 17-1]MCT4780182.1 Asp-tRNA(Asn)/Glu-tRNA(Gln) amidotransferase subunit GatC [Exiguobacterium soli]MCT4792922.1 Asp-tRNA(Asn)/Glu-tRNA(Gln) amidotransferase subunit GatC [Exiguobacterium artemiae]MDW2884448.1 Asp-tRNA(Asn)/Glu-tRNA(Gln) amidotransferase subunit GatC [Exiguobacterium sibiricum]MDX1259387.1 Asp-tRNA
MAKINEEQVRHVAHLARLAVTDEEVQQFTVQLEKILGFAEQLNELDTTGVEPTTHVLDLKNVLRKDEVRPSLPRTEVERLSPDWEDGQVRVPAVFE